MGDLCGVYTSLVMTVEEIAEEASKLSEQDRATLASEILRGLEPPLYEVSDEEVKNRVKEGEENSSILITGDELEAGLQRRGN